jgi:hypothetical protein
MSVLDFLLGTVQAYQQVGMFIGALVCLGLGGLILGNCLYWRIHALRASGTIIGVLTNGSSYTPVYRYALPDGQTHVAKSDTSSSAARGKETGRIVPLMICAHDPTQARAANNYLLDVVGLVLIVPGVCFGYTALTAFPITPMTWIMAVALLAYLAERGHRVLIPKGQRVSVAQWRRQHGLGDTAAINLAAVRPIEDVVSALDIREGRSQSSRKAAPLIGLFAVILVCVGILQAKKIARLEAAGLRAQGEVVRLKDDFGSGHTTYYPIVKFRTERNVLVEFKDNVGSNPPSHRPGDKVTVLYLADNPRQEAMVDRGVWWNWGIPGIIFSFAGFLAGLLVVILRSGTPLDTPGGAGRLLRGTSQSRA